MNKFLQLFAMLVIVAIVAAAACYVSVRWFGPLQRPPVENHEWIHKQLNLTRDELKALEPIESKFTEHKRSLAAEIRSANKELAEAIEQDQTYSSRVSAALTKIQQAQSSLQEATLQHVFEMKSVLSPEQYHKLLDLTTNELNQVNDAE
jgi:Spy/CpxP family protein refolding chaperone